MEGTQSNLESLLEAWLPLLEQAWPLEWKLDRELPMVLNGLSGPLVVEVYEDDEGVALVSVWVDDVLLLEDAEVSTPEEVVEQASAAFLSKLEQLQAVPLPRIAPDDATSARISPAMLEGGEDKRKGDTE
ncbi:MAG TPA: hypothetical protein VFS21_07300 [Roseiflexaceae bacterium]|nr:hypothetical protein [Roseiflexaceae bacterium]